MKNVMRHLKSVISSPQSRIQALKFTGFIGATILKCNIA